MAASGAVDGFQGSLGLGLLAEGERELSSHAVVYLRFVLHSCSSPKEEKEEREEREGGELGSRLAASSSFVLWRFNKVPPWKPREKTEIGVFICFVTSIFNLSF